MRKVLTTTRIAIAVGLITGLSAGAATQLQASAKGDKQCYHTGSGTCESCKNSCLGAGYVCCSIIVDPM